MPRLRPASGLLLIVALAAVGGLLVYLPPRIVEQYERAQSLGPPWSYLYLGLVSTGGILLVGVSVLVLWKLWRATVRKRAARIGDAKNPSELSAREKQRQVADNLAAAHDLKSDPSAGEDLRRELQALAAKVEEKQAAQTLEIVAFGTISSGKSSLLNALAGRDVFQTDPRGGTTTRRQEVPWPGADRVLLVDTPGLGEIDGVEHVAAAAAAAQEADLVLLVVDGPLRESEHRLLTRLGEMGKRVLLCLNKADWYESDQQALLLGQLVGQVRGIVLPEDVVAVRSQPAARTRVRVLSDGTERDEPILELADISQLAARMLAVVRRDGHDLLLANLLLQSRGLVEEARARVRSALDQRAWEIVDRYTWAAGAAAALSPTVLDLFVSSALTTKMVVDLSRVYRQEVDFNTIVSLLAQLGKNLIAFVGVTAVAPTLAAAVASLLKTIPLAGTITGGALQGVVQALVTRWIGGVFIHYFQHEMQLPSDGLANFARREWQRLTSPAELGKFLGEAKDRLMRR